MDNNCAHQCNNHERAIEAVFKKITGQINAITTKVPLVTGMKVDAPRYHFRRLIIEQKILCMPLSGLLQ